MKIGIIIHSQTGHTYAVAERVKEKLEQVGHTVNLMKVIAENDSQSDLRKILLTSTPDSVSYDALIFGAPVRGFSLSPVLTAYLSQIATMHGKKVGCFVTQQFPFAWMGGNRAIRQMRKLCAKKGAEIGGTGVVNWSSKSRGQKIADLVEEFGGIF